MRVGPHTLLKALVAFACVLLTLPSAAQAPQFDAARLPAPSMLQAQWLVNAGDDAAYAQPDFDDSHWTHFDPSTSLTRLYGNTRPSIAWYRLRVKVDPAQKGLALDEWNICRAFEIYVNGERLIANGSVAPYRGYTFAAHIRAPIPDRMLQSGQLLIAIRVHLTQSEWAGGQNPGYYVNNLKIGDETTLEHEDWLTVIGANALDWLMRLLFLGLGSAALVLFLAQRSQWEYLWIVGVSIVTVLQAPSSIVLPLVNVPAYAQVLFALPRLASPWLWCSLYFAFVGHRVGWRWRAFFVFAGITNYLAGLQGWVVPEGVQYGLFLSLPHILMVSGIIPIVLLVHWRRGNREAGILLIPVIFFSLYIYAQFTLVMMFEFSVLRQFAAHGFTLINQFPVGPFSISFETFSDVLCVLSMAVIILLRSTRMSRRQALLEAEMEAAQQVQQVLVPEKTASVLGFAVDAVYVPAQQVGGDFFQVLPARDGGLLVVVGDVAGKGLPAAMLVSALVGSIRTAADDTHAPEVLLRRLNERLVGRTQGGFTTALAAHIAADGAVTLANAGHLPPYLDGREVELPGTLPLGVAMQIHYDTHRLHLSPGSRLTFYSDGVVEAQNRRGELFGFERAREFAMHPAGAIADAAQEFGQSDDITVVTIVREQVAVSAA